MQSVIGCYPLNLEMQLSTTAIQRTSLRAVFSRVNQLRNDAENKRLFYFLLITIQIKRAMNRGSSVNILIDELLKA